MPFGTRSTDDTERSRYVAERKNEQQPQVQQQDDQFQRVSRATAEAQKEAAAAKLDETVPGGKYKVGDTFVNADGEPVKDAEKDE
jgi:hypothetical protein